MPVRSFFKWLTRQNYILSNPAAELILPRPEKRLPRYVLTAAEAERVLAKPDLETPLGIRDRAILETLYSTGVRRGELLHLHVSDLDHERGTLAVRRGKGKKDRIIPIGERAVSWVDKYQREVRPSLVVEPDQGVLFLSVSGDALSPNRLSEWVRRYIAAELGKHGSCHLFRHTMATLLLEAGADIRFIQAMLGHERKIEYPCSPGPRCIDTVDPSVRAACPGHGRSFGEYGWKVSSVTAHSDRRRSCLHYVTTII